MHMKDEMAEATAYAQRAARRGDRADPADPGGPTGEAVDNPEHPPEESIAAPHRGPGSGRGG